MSGYSTVLYVHRLEKSCDELGLMMCYSRYGGGDVKSKDRVAVKPKDNDSWPLFARDSELFAGTLDELEAWLAGIQFARRYDVMLFGAENDKKRDRKEQDVRNKQLVSLITNS